MQVFCLPPGLAETVTLSAVFGDDRQGLSFKFRDWRQGFGFSVLASSCLALGFRLQVCCKHPGGLPWRMLALSASQLAKTALLLVVGGRASRDAVYAAQTYARWISNGFGDVSSWKVPARWDDWLPPSASALQSCQEPAPCTPPASTSRRSTSSPSPATVARWLSCEPPTSPPGFSGTFELILSTQGSLCCSQSPKFFSIVFFGRGAFDTPPTRAFKSWYARQTAACWDRGLASIVAVSDDEDTSQSVSTRQSTPWNPHVLQASCFAAQGFRLL